MNWDLETSLSSDTHEVQWSHCHSKKEKLNQKGETQLSAWFSCGLRVTPWRQEDDFGCQKEVNCLFIQITPKTMINHLSSAFCSFMAHCIHKNCSQYYLCSIYAVRVCNPLKYKSFPYNPCTCKSLQIFHTFLSHQQKIVLTPSMNA